MDLLICYEGYVIVPQTQGGEIKKNKTNCAK